MPGPGHKKPKARAKRENDSRRGENPANGSAMPDSYVGDIDHATDWIARVEILCRVFDIPDIATRSGLKKVHANFEAIYRRLDEAYQKYSENEKIAGGIVGIYAKMCADSILRDKLFAKGLLVKLMPLVNIDFSRHMALRALGTITHHGGIPIRMEIAKYSSVLIRLIEGFPDDKKVIELAITTLAHCANAVLEGDSPADPKLLASLDMRTIVKVVTENTRKEWASPHLINHAISLLSMSTLHATDACKSYPPMLKFLVAGLRSKDWVTRCICFGGIIRLHRKESEPDMRMLNPMAFTAAVQRGFPPHLNDLMLAYGPMRCDTYLTLSTSRDFQQAMISSAQDHDLYALGLKMAEFILRTEFSIGDGYFQSMDGQYEVVDVGLPFTRYIDSLPHCAKAIRARRVEGEADMADTLDIKFSIMKQRIPEAVDLAKKALKRNPDGAYFYYAITLSANHVEGLRAAKKGLKCKKITPFVRFQLMQRAVEHAGDMGIQILQDSPMAGKTKWEEGIAFLMSALEDAKTFVDQAPPDNRHMNAILYWFILLTITIRESELSTDLRELQGALRTSKIADDFSMAIGVTPPKTNMRLGQKAVVKLYPSAVQEFGSVIAKLDSGSPDASVPVSQEKLEDDLAAWLEDMHVDDGEHDSKLSGLHPIINTNHVALYRCSWCGNPSAVLRKCSGCTKTRYCDAGCQRSHWKDHKKFCNVGSA